MSAGTLAPANADKAGATCTPRAAVASCTGLAGETA
jgi:hypothetical protein